MCKRAKEWSLLNIYHEEIIIEKWERGKYFLQVHVVCLCVWEQDIDR